MATCADCRFGEFKDGHDYGRCRIRPPRAIEDGTFGGSSLFPRVSTHDWCGEQQPEKADRAASIETMASMLEPFLAVADAMAVESAAMLITLDLRDAEGEPLELSSIDFTNLAAAWEAVRGA